MRKKYNLVLWKIDVVRLIALLLKITAVATLAALAYHYAAQ